MKRVEQRISPAGFAMLQEELLRAELMGYGPTECAAMALLAVGLGVSHWPPEPCETVFIVDYKLDGPIYPFMDWPKGWVKNDPTTWR